MCPDRPYGMVLRWLSPAFRLAESKSYCGAQVLVTVELVLKPPTRSICVVCRAFFLSEQNVKLQTAPGVQSEFHRDVFAV